jgi:hypothetical protein
MKHCKLNANIVPLSNIIRVDRNGKLICTYPSLILKKPGLYCFWWINKDDTVREILKSSNREVTVLGTKGSPQNIAWDWNLSLKFVPLYIGKTTNLSQRMGQHLMLNTWSWYWYQNQFMKNFFKKTLHRREKLTTCQFRSGFEHLFKYYGDPMKKEILLNNIGYSYVIENNFVNRFYEEDFQIGKHKPWFNIDSER